MRVEDCRPAWVIVGCNAIACQVYIVKSECAEREGRGINPVTPIIAEIAAAHDHIARPVPHTTIVSCGSHVTDSDDAVGGVYNSIYTERGQSVAVKGAGTDADRTEAGKKISASYFTGIRTCRHLVECDGAIGGSTQTSLATSMVVVEGAGTDADCARGTTAVVLKISAISAIGTSRHFVKRDGAVGESLQTIICVVVEGAGTDADRSGATTAVILKISAKAIGLGRHVGDRDGAVGESLQTGKYVAFEGAGTDADRSRATTAVIFKKGTMAGITLGRHLVERDDAVGISIQAISSGVATEGARTDADRSRASAVI